MSNPSSFSSYTSQLNVTSLSRVNPVETLYAAFPAFMYIDPSLGAPLLEPLFRLQAHPNYTIPYAAGDLGGCLTGKTKRHILRAP